VAYGIIQFIEGGQRKITLVRSAHGQPTGSDGLMDPLTGLIEESSPAFLREGSPGAERMAMVFFAREQQAGRELKILGADGEWGITAEEIRNLQGDGFYYEVDVGRAGERSVPRILASGVQRSATAD
jgi:hypothetical protein